MENFNHEYIFEQLKLKIYFFILPFVIIATAVGWIMDFFYSDSPISFDSYLFPILDIWLCFVFAIMLLKKRVPRQLELVSFAVTTIVYLTWFTNTISNNVNNGSISGGLGEFTNWVPLFFIFVTLIFERKASLFVSSMVFFTTLVIGISIIFTSHQEFKLQIYDSLIQYYISNATYILALYFLQRIKGAFIQKEAMEHLANTDFLTALPNRRLVEKHLKDNVNKEKKFSIILFDIDYFKKINDQYGHAVGDQVLQEFATLIQNNVRDQDIVGRWGGEEFILIANDLDGKQSAVFSERLRKLIESTTFSHGELVTASFGVTEYYSKEKVQDTLKRADIALYLAKDNGRNKIHIQM